MSKIKDFFRRGQKPKKIQEPKEMECKRQVKYDGIKMEIAGLNFKGLTLGKLGLERQVLQGVGHSLMLLDFAEYDLCVKVRNAPNQEDRNELYKRMMDDRFKGQATYRAIAALMLNPNSKELLNNLTQTFSSNLERALEVEKSAPRSIVSDAKVTEDNSIEIGDMSLAKRVESLRQSYSIGQDIVAKAKFYYNVIFNFDKMLGNPRFVRLRNPEDRNKVHDTLVKIDKLMEKNFVEREITRQYWEFRGPWEDFYTDDPLKRAKFARLIRDFRNKLARTYNKKILPVYNEKAEEKLEEIEQDLKEYKIQD